MKQEKIVHDLSMLYLEKSSQQFESVEQFFNEYIKISNNIDELFSKHKSSNEDVTEWLKLMDKYIK